MPNDYRLDQVFLLSIILGIFLTLNAQNPRWFLLLPAFFFIRMAFNAMNGMLARNFHQKSNLGAHLNELSDVISDAFLYLPFAYVRGFDPLSIGAVIVLAVTSELAGIAAPMTGASRLLALTIVHRVRNGLAKADEVLFCDYSDENVRLGWALIREKKMDCIARFEKGDAFDRNSLAAVQPKATLGVVSGLYELFPDNAPVRESLAGLSDASRPADT